MESAGAQAIAAGARFGRYRILSVLGAGGMGQVFEAEDTALGRAVAVKVLPPARSDDPEERSRLEREARTLATLDHPNIVTVHAVEQFEGRLFLVMELVRGLPLTQLIPAAGLPPAEFFRIALALADALGAAHRQGVTHRDLKPENVMVTPEGRVKVLDFGLAKVATRDATGATATSVTMSGAISGTAPYMSPEQAQGRSADARSDLFSLGIVLHEMATGRRPFEGDTILTLAAAILRDPPPRFPRRVALPGVERIVRRCLEKDPLRRYQSAIDLHWDLAAAQAERSRRPGRRAVALVGGVVIVAGVALASRLSWRAAVPSKNVALTTESPAPVVPPAARARFHLAEPITYSAGVLSKAPAGAAVDDFNGDGRLDVAVAKMETNDHRSGAIAVLLGKGDGTLGAARETLVGLHPRPVVVADFDGDGKRDLATACSLGQRVDILLGRRDGTFQPRPPIDLQHGGTGEKRQPYPESLAVTSLEPGGEIDMVVGEAASSSVSILLGHGTGYFSRALGSPAAVGNTPRSVVAVDVDRDQHKDVITANGDGTISILIRNSTGVFRAARTFVAGAELGVIIAAPFRHGLGIDDLAVTDRALGLVHVIQNVGGGTFKPPVDHAVGSRPNGLAAGDLNGDGEIDLAVANEGSDTLSLLAGRGDGTFDPAINLPLAPGPFAVALGDLDGDGDLDVVVTQIKANLVSVLRNAQR